ncbi:sigma 54-interacting transcriptional regulator [Natronincola ferrireducens]|uniref:PAS domain S-box-containing protein n=1 Tax=Natronincola ferrireducens TaxID=393762 RepID=A0A1G8YK36_9FIRM|nr:sigma 54-interacting transcriptional regulator [Natronincola ferrireducens]SDK03178.1 PAS domain S-box-containing protein [Natronincola ferrireducens]
MGSLKRIADSVQQVAEAISLAVGIETEIVDNELTIVGGTNRYRERLGEKEESGKLSGDYLYGRMLRQGETVVVEDARRDINYDYSTTIGATEELAEICTPIKADEKIIGIIGLVAFTKEQQQQLLKNKDSMILFVERMADLLASKALENEVFDRVKTIQNEIMTILETIHEGMLSIDGKGYINYCNSNAEILLKTIREEIIGRHISHFMPNSPALKVLETGEGYTEHEEMYKNSENSFHFIVTAKAILGKSKPRGVVISFRDIVEARKLIYNMSEMSMSYTFDDIIGDSDSITRIKTQAHQVARGYSTVLITGESGTGKELFSRAIHYSSPRKKGPFITVNCGAIPETLLESELFGYERGAFTGAKEKGKVGKFELADGGTIFLDEIGDMPLHLQVKLLHVLQNRRFERVGGNKTILIDVRVIAATNKNLEEMIHQKKFREDLYYRLSVIPLKIPSLRERGEDILLLKDYFLKKYNAFLNKRIKGFSRQVEELYLAYDWPGNVRELENAVEYGVNMTLEEEIQLEAVPPRIKKLYSFSDAKSSSISLQDQVKRFEKEIFIKKLTEKGSSQNGKLEIAEELGISRATLYRKLAEYNLS